MTKTINPFAQIFETVCAFFNTEKFYNLREQSIGSRTIYVFIISIICSIIFCSIHAVTMGDVLGEMIDILPEFSYSNGCIQCVEQYEMLENGLYISVNTEQPVYNSDYLYKLAEQPDIVAVVLVSATNYLIYVEDEKDYHELKYAELFEMMGIDFITKQQILSGYPGFVIKIAIVFIFLIIPYNLMKLFGFALMFTLFALIIKSIKGSSASFSTLYWISFYMESFFLIAISIGKPLFSDYGWVLHLACLLIFVITMNRVLKHEDSFLQNVTTIVYNPDDDFDAYVLRIEEENYPKEMKSTTEFSWKRDE